MLLVCVLGLASRAWGAIRVVDPVGGPYLTIQSALDSSAPGDTVEVVPGTYFVQLVASIPVLLRSREGPEATILDGEGVRRLLEFRDIELIVAGFTFQNGRATRGGAAIRCTDASFQIVDCVFRDNHAYRRDWMQARAEGGAILADGEASGAILECLFVRNEVEGLSRAYGGAISVQEVIYDAAERPSTIRVQILDCSFISNRASSVAAILSSRPIEVRRCLFADKRDSYGPFVALADGSQLVCNLYQYGISPQVEGTWSKTVGENQEVDPRLCPGDPERLHESSPALSGEGGCGRIGNLPVGCTGPVVLAARPLVLQPVAEQVVRAYGYGLEEVLEARLIGPGGERVASRGHALEGLWFTASFDLRGRPPGAWTLALRTATAGEIRLEGMELAPVQIYGFFEGWVDAPSIHEDRIAGRNLVDGMDLSLRQGVEGAPIPIEVIERIGDDTLRVRVDLRQAAEGAYDLEAHLPGGGTTAVRPALHLGAPAVVRVPEDAPSIAEALETAPSCAEVRVGPGTYNETLVIRKPVRLIAAGQAYQTQLHPGAAGDRVLHILPEAGPLTDIERLTISEGGATGPGGGILCEAPARIRDCSMSRNQAEGAGARGGGLFAAEGARVIGNTFYANSSAHEVPPNTPWSLEPPESGGAGGGLFCLRCWVEGNEFDSNRATLGGQAVVDGEVRSNRVNGFLGDYHDTWPIGAFRGEITGNRFDNCCGTQVPYLLIDGPSRVARNTFTDVAWELCGMYDSIHLTGSADLIENVFYNVGLRACLMTDGVSEPLPGHLRMERNAFLGWLKIELSQDDSQGACIEVGPREPRMVMGPDSLLFSCNVIEHAGIEAVIVRDGSEIPCSNCVAELQDLPFGCPDTLPSFSSPCWNAPARLQSWRIEPAGTGVRLHWDLSPEEVATAFDIERAHGGRRERLTREPLAPCRSCDFIDTAPLGDAPAVYWLILHRGVGESAAHRLGEWTGAGAVAGDAGLFSPAPHPVKDRATLRFDLPGAGGPVRLEVLDLQGRRIDVLHDGPLPGGRHMRTWEPRDPSGRRLASGLYVLKLSLPGRSWTRKFLVLR
jgi:hypothetical protein